MNLFKLTGFATILGCLSIAVNTSAAVIPWFEIEIILFEHSTEGRITSEKWQNNSQFPQSDNSIDFLTADPSTKILDKVCVKGQLLSIESKVDFEEVIEDVVEVPLSAVNLVTEVDTLLSNPLAVDSIEVESTNNDESDVENAPEIPFVILDKSLNQLTDVSQSLTSRRGYRKLLHISWRQPVESEKNSRLIRLYAGNNYSDSFKPDGKSRVDIATYDSSLSNDVTPEDLQEELENVPDESSSSDNNTRVSEFMAAISDGFEPSKNIVVIDPSELISNELNDCERLNQQQTELRHPDVWQLDGNIRIYVERYLHLETDLFLRIEGKEELELSALETSLAADRLISSLQDDLNSTLDFDKPAPSQEPTIFSNEATTRDFPSLNTSSLNKNLAYNWQLDENFLSGDSHDSIVVQDVLNDYSMQQSRRLRSNELHYIDHPLFGMLIHIRPYDPNKIDVDTSEI